MNQNGRHRGAGSPEEEAPGLPAKPRETAKIPHQVGRGSSYKYKSSGGYCNPSQMIVTSKTESSKRYV